MELIFYLMFFFLIFCKVAIISYLAKKISKPEYYHKLMLTVHFLKESADSAVRNNVMFCRSKVILVRKVLNKSQPVLGGLYMTCLHDFLR